ncbi:MAG: hypothetical protein IKT27_05470 [Clostridia bacterium]|nr:hypothetical protein [Clostridia bacterium]
MKTLNKILCKATDFVLGMAEFISMTVGLIVKWAILSVFGIAAVALAAFLWLSVPTALAYATCGNGPVTQTVAFAILGIYASWTILLKIAYDRWDKNNSRLEKFFEEFNKRS